MQQYKLFLLSALFMVMMACKSETSNNDTFSEPEVTETESKEATTEEVTELRVPLSAKSDSGVSGTAIFTEKDGMVTMVAMIEGLNEGEHAIHLHESSDCSSADGTSTGGHWNPTAQPHGKWGAETGYHKGDIGNFTANSEGKGTITFTTNQWCIGCGDPAKDIVGKAIIVHQGVDDFTSQPSGAAGTRISCGGIIN